MKSVFAWHRPLMTVAALMLVSTIACLVGLLVDPRMVTGLDVWTKPLKFSISILLYSVTWAWLIAHLPRWRRTAHVAGTVVAVALVVEQALILGAAAAGTTSHFNISTPLATGIWTTMAVSITVLYICTFLTTIAVFFLRLPTRSTTIAVRAGAAIALVGMGLAYLMTSPTSQQLDDFQGIAGAHTVGIPDGGPGLPLLGWSTVAGDLRIPHFVGMHALQLLPLIVATVVYSGTVALVTFQALAGQSIVRPGGVFLWGGWALAIGGVLSAALVLVTGRRRRPQPDDRPALEPDPVGAGR